jgi:hypothetical protein
LASSQNIPEISFASGYFADILAVSAVLGAA